MSNLTSLRSFRSRAPTKWQISMALTPILLIFAIYSDSGSQIHRAKYEQYMINSLFVNRHHNFGKSLTLKAKIKKLNLKKKFHFKD